MTLVCPFVYRGELLPSLLLAIELESAAPVLIGVAGLVLLFASAIRRIRPDVRATVVAGAAVLAAGCLGRLLLRG